MRSIVTRVTVAMFLQCALGAFVAAEAQRPAGSGSRSHGVSASPRVAAPAQQQVDGKQVFSNTCAACHQANGEGMEGSFPPLVGSEWVADEEKLVRIILHGLSGPVEVAGVTYSGMMPGWGAMLKDAEIAAVATYVRSAWNNKSAAVTTAKVGTIRGAHTARTTPWTVPELAKAATEVKKE